MRMTHIYLLGPAILTLQQWNSITSRSGRLRTTSASTPVRLGNLSSIGKDRVLTPWVILFCRGQLGWAPCGSCSNLTMGSHLDELSNCASSIHALRMLRTHGLQPPQLQEVARMTTVASLLYASPAWWGFTSAQDRDRLECMVGRLRRCGYLPESAPSFAEMASKADKS